MNTWITKGLQFPYHSLRYEFPTRQTNLLQRAEYLFMAEEDHPLRGQRFKVYWAASSCDELVIGLNELTPMLAASVPQPKLYIEHVPPEFVSTLEAAGFTIVSEWVDFWIEDLQALELHPLATPFIRQMDSAELSTVAAITRSCKGLSREFYGETDESVQEWLDDSDTEILVAEIDGTLVGSCFMAQYAFDHPQGSVAWLRELAVSPEYQYHGVGRALATRCLLWGQVRGASRGFLATDVENHHAIRFYESLGFRRREERGQINMVR